METLTNPASSFGESRETGSRSHERVQQALDLILSSPPFRNTLQGQTLLRYIVKHTLAGEDNLLRERVIGSEVFGRRPDYETGDDPVVRIRVAEVRKRLAQYYQSLHETPDFYIEIPSGSYRATFRGNDNHQEVVHGSVHGPSSPIGIAQSVPEKSLAAISAIEAEPPSSSYAADISEASKTSASQQTPSRPGRVWKFWCAAAVLLSLAGIATWVSAPWESNQSSRFKVFWSPWTNSLRPVIIVIGSNAVYRLSDKVTDKYAQDHQLETHGQEFFVPFEPTATLHGSDLTPAENSFVALGDVASVSALVATITRQKQTFQERFPNDISFAELRNSPTLLVGGFNNLMTLELTKDLRFVMRARNEIDDTQDPHRRWLLHASEDSHDTEDYAIVTRLIQRPGDAPMLSVAGMGQYGTLAAADFVCNPAAISDMVHHLPSNWANENLQLILHVKVIDFKPVATEVVAVHAW
jgi:hypothetical protein